MANFHSVTGGVYKARERIHHHMADPIETNSQRIFRVLGIPLRCVFLVAGIEHARPWRHYGWKTFLSGLFLKRMWLFLEVRTLLPDQGNKEKIERVMNSIELALLDRIILGTT
ncbi:hypothetical protein KY290_031684 [Solanum tuberosum]|uniref:Uncharacterized protein n=1 Tax=Solanum tuberosum TaxID=4113 RepID=A0ABQ7UA44_SOLTU|nr:hypothetical protein KY284_030750 [Solanum tuberosum]KAH0650839.1 hypothetical protein KY284_030751 [Solanum tuberosum]KAH0653399.1 hypothetical protein KY289_031077 [Solanum tuberosum]KAH0653400.1 hypothetical protein KY289_031078 [Solanum tuberosum]KAH0743691.1 hypothetical protein KY290_031684 [Solanum tuberosum]